MGMVSVLAGQAIKGSSTTILQVKLLTTVAGEATGTYEAYPFTPTPKT